MFHHCCTDRGRSTLETGGRDRWLARAMHGRIEAIEGDYRVRYTRDDVRSRPSHDPRHHNITHGHGALLTITIGQVRGNFGIQRIADEHVPILHCSALALGSDFDLQLPRPWYNGAGPR